jgi:hypothetical protein
MSLLVFFSGSRKFAPPPIRVIGRATLGQTTSTSGASQRAALLSVQTAAALTSVGQDSASVESSSDGARVDGGTEP